MSERWNGQSIIHWNPIGRTETNFAKRSPMVPQRSSGPKFPIFSEESIRAIMHNWLVVLTVMVLRRLDQKVVTSLVTGNIVTIFATARHTTNFPELKVARKKTNLSVL